MVSEADNTRTTFSTKMFSLR